MMKSSEAMDACLGAPRKEDRTDQLNSKWKEIYDGGIHLGFKNMVWYGDRVWCTNDYGVWTIHNDKITMMLDLPAEIAVCRGNLAVGDGVMLLAGLDGAALMRDGKWESILLRPELEKMVKAER